MIRSERDRYRERDESERRARDRSDPKRHAESHQHITVTHQLSPGTEALLVALLGGASGDITAQLIAAKKKLQAANDKLSAKVTENAEK